MIVLYIDFNFPPYPLIVSSPHSWHVPPSPLHRSLSGHDGIQFPSDIVTVYQVSWAYRSGLHTSFSLPSSPPGLLRLLPLLLPEHPNPSSGFQASTSISSWWSPGNMPLQSNSSLTLLCLSSIVKMTNSPFHLLSYIWFQAVSRISDLFLSFRTFSSCWSSVSFH